MVFIILATMFALLYGGLIEYLQSHFFNRTGDIVDLMADVVGGFIGAFFSPTLQLLLYHQILKKIRKHD